MKKLIKNGLANIKFSIAKLKLKSNKYHSLKIKYDLTQDNTSLVKRSAFSKKYFKEIPKLLTLKKIEIIENQANHCTLPTKNPKK